MRRGGKNYGGREVLTNGGGAGKEVYLLAEESRDYGGKENGKGTTRGDAKIQDSTSPRERSLEGGKGRGGPW